MRRKAKPPSMPAPSPEDTSATDEAVLAPIVERPDGYYWQAPDGHQEFGPFESYEQAEADRDAFSEESLAPDETLQEIEQATGVADWLDAETGDSAEGESPPHLRED